MKSFLNMVKILYDNPYDVVLGRCKNKKCIFLLAKDEPNAVESNILNGRVHPFWRTCCEIVSFMWRKRLPSR